MRLIRALSIGLLFAGQAAAERFGLSERMSLVDFANSSNLEGEAMVGAYWVWPPKPDKRFSTYEATISKELGLCSVIARSSGLNNIAASDTFEQLAAELTAQFGTPETLEITTSVIEHRFLDATRPDELAATLKLNQDSVILSTTFGEDWAECAGEAMMGN